MQDVEILHREAMELVDQAFLARQKGDATAAVELTKAAFAQERAAADLVANLFDLEPTLVGSSSQRCSACCRMFRIARGRKVDWTRACRKST